LTPPRSAPRPQAYYLEAPFAIERAPTAPLHAVPKAAAAGTKALGAGLKGGPRAAQHRGVSVHQLLEYPVRTLVFEAGDSLAEVRFWGGGPS
jgi:hypothetical protein